MPVSPQKFIFDLSTNEITNRLQNVVVNILCERKEQNLPLVYKNYLCTGRINLYMNILMVVNSSYGKIAAIPKKKLSGNFNNVLSNCSG